MTDLNALFELDPLDLTDENIDEVIAGYRDKYKQYNLGDTKAGSLKKSVPKALKGVEPDALAGLDIKL